MTIIDEGCENSLEKFNKIMSNGNLLFKQPFFPGDVIVIENKIFFETYVHYLRSLQKAEVNNLPFKEILVYASKKVPLLCISVKKT